MRSEVRKRLEDEVSQLGCIPSWEARKRHIALRINVPDHGSILYPIPGRLHQVPRAMENTIAGLRRAIRQRREQ